MVGMRSLALGAALALASIAAHVDAHHSTAIYDSDNPIELAGTVVEWQFVNPHVLHPPRGRRYGDRRQEGLEPRGRQHGGLVPPRLDAEHAEGRRPDHADRPAVAQRLAGRQLQQSALGRRQSHRAETRGGRMTAAAQRPPSRSASPHCSWSAPLRAARTSPRRP